MIDPRMKIRHLQCFMEVARLGHVGRAADLLAVTQPAVSKTLRELEEFLNVRLFTRGPKGLALTPMGEAFQYYAATGVVAVWTTFQTNYSYTPVTNALVIVEGTGDYEGVTFKIMGTGQTLWDCGRGDVVEVSGTIKGHGEYEGVKQTQLTRAKVVVTEAAETEDA